MKKNFRQKKTRRSQKKFGLPQIDDSKESQGDRQYRHPTKGLRSMTKDRDKKRWRRRRQKVGKQA